MLLNTILFSFKLVLLLMIFTQNVISFRLFQYADEILLIISFFIILVYGLHTFFARHKLPTVLVVFFALIIYSLINFFISPFSNSFILMFLQNLISLKAFIILLGFMILYKDMLLYNRLIEIFFYTFIILFVLSLGTNYLLGTKWHGIFNHPVGYRDGLLRPTGLMGNPGNVGNFFIFTFTTLVVIYNRKYIQLHPYRFVILYAVILFFSVFIFTVRKPLLMLLPLLLFIRPYTNKLYYKMFVVLLAISFASLLLFGKGNYSKITRGNLQKFITIEDNSYIRGLMFAHSIDFFAQTFPFGTSPATFGSNLSQMNTMKAYKEKGLTELNWLYNKKHELEGIYDTGLGSLIAEYGFIGMLLIILFIIYFYRFWKRNFPNIFTHLSLLFTYILLITIISPAIMNDLQSCFITINVLFIFTKNRLIQYDKGVDIE